MGNALKIVAGLCVLALAVVDSVRQPHAVSLLVSLRYVLGALAGGLLIGGGWRGLHVRRDEREHAQFFHTKIQAAIRESDERGLRVKTVAARLAALEPLEGQLRERDRSLAQLSDEITRLRDLPTIVEERIVEIDRPVIIERVVEIDRPVIVEKVVEVDRPVVVAKVIEVDRPVIVEKTVLVSVPRPPAAPPARPVTARAARPRRAAGVPLKRPRRPRKRPADDLESIRGVGPKLARFLNDHGITQFRQVARWTDADIDRFEAELPRFKGRIRREGWVQSAAEQYRLKYGRDV